MGCGRGGGGSARINVFPSVSTRIPTYVHAPDANVLAWLFIKNCERATGKIKESGQKSLRADFCRGSLSNSNSS